MEPVFIRRAGPIIVFEVNRALLVHFLEVIEMTSASVHFNIGGLDVKLFLKWNMSANTIPAKEIADVISAKASARLKHLKLTVFASFSDPSLQKISTRRVLQVLRASLAVAMNAKKETCVGDFFYGLPRAGQNPVELIIGSQFRQTVLNSVCKALLLRWTSNLHPFSRSLCLLTV